MNSHIDNPHVLSAKSALEELMCDSYGLAEQEAKDRLQDFGSNSIPDKETVHPIFLLLKQFKSWLIVILLAAAIISWFAEQVVDTWVILVVIIINAGIGFFQEFRAEKAIASLKKMIVKTTKVLRNSHLVVISSDEVVPGDIMVLEEGDSIAADARIIESKNLRTIEAPLTGESLPVAKNLATCLPETPMADRKNMVWKGTFVAGGYAHAVVTGTGSRTMVGEISATLGKIKEMRSPFLQKTDVLARQMALIAGLSAAVIFLVGYLIRGFEIKEILLTSIAALVAAVPEGLPAVISIVLAIGARRMAKQNAIIRETSAIETLGATTAILTDKTGTLTQNTLTACKLFIPWRTEFSITGEGWFPAGNFIQNEAIVDPDQISVLRTVLEIAAFSNNSEIRHDAETGKYQVIGDPTEGALLVLARKGGIQPVRANKIDDLPFNSHQKLRATLIGEEGSNELLVAGAPEKLLENSAYALSEGGLVKLDSNLKQEIEEKVAEWSNQSMRVLALAKKTFEGEKIGNDPIKDLVFAGIVGMMDPPRPDAKKAVEDCRRAGIRVVMVTGDHINTAVAIAKSTSIITDADTNELLGLTESQLVQLDEDEFDEVLRTVSVFARLTPRMKLRIARRFQASGHSIAMTGDGVNDAPALKQANVGIAMGIMGTDVARNSSDMVLADDNFATIVKAVEEGRRVFANSRQTSFFLITTNIAESVTLISTIALGLPIPLIATQILWLNLVTDSFPAIALANEKSRGNIGSTIAREKDENILNRNLLPFLAINVGLMTLVSLVIFRFYLPEDLNKARTAVFLVMAFMQLFNAYNLRSLKQSVFTIGPFSNRSFNIAMALSALMLVFITRVPIVASVFHFKHLPLLDFSMILFASSLVLWAVELYKLWVVKMLK